MCSSNQESINLWVITNLWLYITTGMWISIHLIRGYCLLNRRRRSLEWKRIYGLLTGNSILVTKLFCCIIPITCYYNWVSLCVIIDHLRSRKCIARWYRYVSCEWISLNLFTQIISQSIYKIHWFNNKCSMLLQYIIWKLWHRIEYPCSKLCFWPYVCQ